jgi:hypothetical protein
LRSKEQAWQIAGRFASRLLSDDSVFGAVQRMFASTLDARRALERNMERLLAGANLPSARDLSRVIEQLAELDREIAGLSKRVAALSVKLTDPAAPDGPHPGSG